MKNREQGESMEAQMLSFWGIQPAPQSIIAPEIQEGWQAREDKAAYKRRFKQPGRIETFSNEHSDEDQPADQ
jgi:hypothetical protein